MTATALKQNDSLDGFHPSIGGYSGTDNRVDRPAKMPAREDCDTIASTPATFIDRVTEDNATIYVEGTIDLTEHVEANGGIQMGSGVTLVGSRCDPSASGSSVIRTDAHTKHLLTSCYGTAPTIWGITFEGPEPESVDLDHTSDEFEERTAGALFCYDDKGTFRVHGCEFRFWSLAGVLCGAKNHTTKTIIERCSFHDGLFEHYGYGIQHYNGFLSVKRSFFDRLRHAISSFGYPNGGYAVADCVFGPGPWRGHLLDMHCLANNLDNGDRTAGEFVRVYRCTSLINGSERDDVNNYGQEVVAIRGDPEKTSYVDRCDLRHPEPPDPTGDQGSAFRQETEWSDTPNSWRNFEPRDNHFGKQPRAGYGAPLAPDPEPKPQPESTKMKLDIHGRGRRTGGDYWIKVLGSAETHGISEPNEKIIDNGDGTVTLRGEAYGHDRFVLSDDAQLLSFRASGVFDLELDNEPVDLAPLIAVAESDRPGDASDSGSIATLKNRVDALANKVDSARVVFGGDDT